MRRCQFEGVPLRRRNCYQREASKKRKEKYQDHESLKMSKIHKPRGSTHCLAMMC